MTGAHLSLGDRRLRDLSDDEFQALYRCDRFTATVLTNRFRYVVAHMANQVKHHAFSPVLRDASDLCGALSGPPELGYAMAAVSETLPLFWGSIADAVRITLDEYGVDDLVPGDVVLVNDYYRVGTHFNDACCIRPLFHEGRMVGAATIRAHFADIGGITMGGFDAAKRNTWEDGLRIPPMLLCSAGTPVKSTLKLLYDNSRLGHLCVPDLITEVRALDLAESLLGETIDRYGLEAFFGAIRHACDASAEGMADGLRSLPDGVYEGEDSLDGDCLPDSPEYKVRVTITKVGDRAEFDFRGTSATTRSAVNAAWPDIKSSLTIALKFLLDPRTPVTSGTLRNVDVVLAPHSIVNASPPTSCMLYFTIAVTAIYAVFDALNGALREDAIATGYVPASPIAYGKGPDGFELQLAVGAGPTILGPWGATRHGDADSSQQGVLSNLTNAGVELYELASPAVWLLSDYMPDTGGAGTYRGGNSNVHDVMWRRDAEHTMQMLLHSRRPSAGGGVHGGRPGPTTTAWLFDGDVSEGGVTPPELPLVVHDSLYRDATALGGRIMPDTNEVSLDGRGGQYHAGTERHPRGAGAVVRVLTTGGGGWGDPWQRDPELVKIDVRDEYVSIAGAARDYGVVVVGDLDHPEQIAVDLAATAALRARRSSS